MELFRNTPLKVHNFKFFLLGHFFSVVGRWIHNIALNWLVYDLTKSSFYLGFLNFLNSSPVIFLSLLSGFLIDKFDRRKLMIFNMFFSIWPPLFLGILTQIGIIKFKYIAVLTLLLGCFLALDIPLRQVYISEIVPFQYLTKAISFQSLSFNIARIIGPLIAGLIILYGNLYYCFYINSFGFFLFFFFLLIFTKSEKKYKEKKKFENLLKSYKEIFYYIKEHPYLFDTLIAICVFTFFGASILVLLPVIVDKNYGGGAQEFSFLSSAIGFGAILGALRVIGKKEIKNKLEHLWKANLILFIGLLGLINPFSWKITIIFCILIGFSFTNFIPIANSFLQENTPDFLRGRIMSLFSISFLGVHPIGNFIVGSLAEKIDINITILIYVTILLVLNTFLLKRNFFRKNIY